MKLKSLLTKVFPFILSLLCVLTCQCSPQKNEVSEHNAITDTLLNKQKKTVITKEADKMELKAPVKVGAAQTSLYFPALTDQNIALVVNQTSRVGHTHLVDTLRAEGVNIVRIFAPEHGFRGTADAGEHVKDSKDAQTGIPIISLYGKNKKPNSTQLQGIDRVIFDIQDVGARFYTYISTLHYVMEACAENKIPLMILDRPNPNGHYVDGPILELAHQSFVGMHPIPIVHGLTMGELAKMINEEGWLENGINCDIQVIPCENYDHTTAYSLPVKPSPNLPNDRSILLYPALCLFEGTTVSVGRGTDSPFQIIGTPDYEKTAFSFTPKSNAGAKYPKHQNKACFGKDLRSRELSYENAFFLTELIHFYQSSTEKASFFNSFFTKLAGTKKLRIQIEKGMTESEIRATWQEELKVYKEKRKKYLLYPDFESKNKHKH